MLSKVIFVSNSSSKVQHFLYFHKHQTKMCPTQGPPSKGSPKIRQVQLKGAAKEWKSLGEGKRKPLFSRVGDGWRALLRRQQRPNVSTFREILLLKSAPRLKTQIAPLRKYEGWEALGKDNFFSWQIGKTQNVSRSTPAKLLTYHREEEGKVWR